MAGPPSRELKRQNSTSRRAVIGEDGEEIVKPGCFTRNVMRCPCAIVWITFLLTLIISALPIAAGVIEIEPTGFAGFDSDTIPEMRDYRTWTAIYESGPIYEPSSEVGSGEAGTEDGYDYPVYFYYSALNSDNNMFDANAVAAMVEAETKLLEMPEWCASLWPQTASPPPARALMVAGRAPLRSSPLLARTGPRTAKR